jgi:hypothetical protein
MNTNTVNQIVETYYSSKNIFFFLGMIILVLLLVFIKISFTTRTKEKIKEYKYHKNEGFSNIKKCYEIKEPSKPRLCEYDICSSYNTGLVGNQKGDYISLDMIKKIILSGARYLEFNIVSNDYSDKPEPYIGIGEATGNWVYSLNVLKINDVFNIIYKYAFYENNNNPLILYINFNNYKEHLINKTGDIIYNKLKEYLLNPTDYKQLPITQEYLCNLSEKIILLSNLSGGQTNNTSFKKINIPQLGFIKRLYYKDAIKYLYYDKGREMSETEIINKSHSESFKLDQEERFKKEYTSSEIIIKKKGGKYFEELLDKFYNPLIHFNKIGMTILLPHIIDDIFTKNIEYEKFREHGIQIITMNFQLFNPSPKAPYEKGSTIMDKYIYYFKENSFILKDSPKFHKQPRIDTNKYIASSEYENNIPEFEPDISIFFNNQPITIELFNKNLFLSHQNTVHFNTEARLFMIYDSFSKSDKQQNSFIISPLKGIMPFDYTKRTFLYHIDNESDNYTFKPLETSKDKLDDFNNKTSIEALKTPICEDNPIPSQNFKLLTLSESYSDYKEKEKENIKYIGNKENKLSQYSINKNKETKENCCFVFKKQKHKLYLYLKIFGRKTYLSSKNKIIKFINQNKPDINNKFEVITTENIFNEGDFNLKNTKGFLKYNMFNETKDNEDECIFKITTDSSGKQNIVLYNPLEKQYSFGLIYTNNTFDFISKEKIKNNNSLECFVEYI